MNPNEKTENKQVQPKIVEPKHRQERETVTSIEPLDIVKPAQRRRRLSMSDEPLQVVKPIHRLHRRLSMSEQMV